ncbi:MAG: DUF92 domain-containing protein [Candidatus Methanomethylophilaceae archaeon]|nr:DUF92 domain-containing protein [Candidatus Methanomethylophilaceae archaeon]MDI9378226.1 DUF92 domain-containing protein [Candidatus Thermoplasmatota archaeon]MDD2779571.1 DUF92 domain-containing protein [Candidatus Methanomethylophilaceae archaeon]MDD3127910.1 DUF92 domain-containing protein [Candidatus Methanomethylophilaceae archaeon]MDD4119561.1 DUF92 domain-containing protein [Candidatus Methanomethylophilaceae archaeon]
MDAVTEIILVLFLSAALSTVAVRVKLLTPSGAVTALAVGLVLGIAGSIYWLIAVLAFAVIGFMVTKLNLSEKKMKGLQEGRSGERTGKNVLGVALPGCMFALINLYSGDKYYFILSVGFIATIAVAAADTVASELGTKDKNVWMITTFERVLPGTDGGISLLGTLLSLMGSAVAVLLGWTVIFGLSFDALMIIPLLAGFIGCLLDSLLGATLETEGRITKYFNNMSTGLMGGIIAVIFVGILG